MLLKQSQTAFNLVFLMIDSTDHISPKTGLTPTVTLSKNGGSFGAAAGAVTEIANGWYKVAANATDANTLGPLVLHATGSGADPVDIMFNVVAFDPGDSVRAGLTAMPNAAAAASGGLLILGANTGTPTLSAFSFTGGTLGLSIFGLGSGSLTVGSATAVNAANLDAAVTSRMATFTLPTNFSSLGISGGGAVTVGTNSDKTGYSLAADQAVNVTKWAGTTVATPDTAGYPKVTVKSGTGTGEISLSSGLVTSGGGTMTVGGYTAGNTPLQSTTTVDGLTISSALELMISLAAGRNTITDNGDGTKTVTFKKQNGSTTKFAVTFNTTTEVRTDSSVS